MNYIYDILLNFHDTLYDFYDWNLGDNIINVRKVPLFRISSTQVKEVKENKIRFHSNFLSKIQNKTELFSGKSIQNIEYCCLLSDGSKAIAVLIKNNMVQKSHLLVDEELEVLEVVARIKEETLEYEILKRDKNLEFKTRKELENEKTIWRNLKKLREENAVQQLRYLYYECFNEKEDDKDKILSRMEHTLKMNFDQIADKLNQFFQLIHTSK